MYPIIIVDSGRFIGPLVLWFFPHIEGFPRKNSVSIYCSNFLHIVAALR